MKVYVSFGQEHWHKIKEQVFDKDTIAEITCADYTDGRRKAFELFDAKFCFVHTFEQIKDKLFLFPKGIISVKETE